MSIRSAVEAKKRRLRLVATLDRHETPEARAIYRLTFNLYAQRAFIGRCPCCSEPGVKAHTKTCPLGAVEAIDLKRLDQALDKETA